MLLKTIKLTEDKLQEIDQLHSNASAERGKGYIADFATVVSYLYGSNAKSKTDKYIGYGGAMLGVIASNHYKKNARVIVNAAKGELGETVSNISLTIEMAEKLKDKLSIIDRKLQPELLRATDSYLSVVSIVYKRVITNYIKYSSQVKNSNPFTQFFYVNAINITGSTEGNQFVYFSHILKIEQSLPVYKDMRDQVNVLNKYNLSEVKKDVIKMHLIAGGNVLLGLVLLIMSSESSEYYKVGPILFSIGIGFYVFFRLFPLGLLKKLKRDVKIHSDYLQRFNNNFQNMKKTI